MKNQWTNYGLLPEEVFRSLTTAVNLDTVIPTIWSPVLEQKYEDLLRLQQFAVMNDELENKPGDEVIINQMNDIGMAVDMEGLPNVPYTGETPMGSETPWNNTDIVETGITTEEVTRLIPTQKFKAVKTTLKALNRSFVNTMQDVTSQLAYSMSSKMEYDSFNSLSSGGTRLGRANPGAVLVGDSATLAMAKDAKEAFDVTVKMNPQFYFEGDTIVCLLHPYQARDITDDSDWEELVRRQPALLQNVFKGELFNYMGVRYVKSTMVKFYAGGALTNVAATGMWNTPTALVPATASKRWYFQSLGVQRKYIAPRYQITDFGVGPNALTVTPDATDVPYKPKIVAVNYYDGFVEFDRPIGATAAPQAVFTWGTLPVFDMMFIGQRAFSVAYKMRPQLTKEITNYGLFVGIGSVADWDVKKLRTEQIFKTLTVG